MATPLPPLGSSGGGGGGGSENTTMNNIMDGEWSNYQEDAINALFPYDPQTGNFTGFADPVVIGVASNNNNWAQSAQDQSQ